MSSIEKVETTLEETIKKTKFTPPSLIKATPMLITSDQDDICLTSFSDAGDVMLKSSSQSKGINVNYSTPTTKDTPEGKPMAVIAVMIGTPKDGYHSHRSNTHYNQKLAQVLLDSGSNGNLVL